MPGAATRSPGSPVPASWPDDPEVRLMLRVQADDERAFAELRERYAARVFGYLSRLLRDRTEAEDFTQEVFLRVYRARHRYQPRARFGTWLYHITQNVGRNALRSRRRRPCVHLDPEAPANQALLEALLAGRQAGDGCPLERAEVAGVVRAAVAGLPDRPRAALELHQFHHHSYAEVAARLDMTPKAAKSLLYRARTQLREVLRGFVCC
ncbi:MAG: RNA polymerase sigma factor [Gemmataceae bacterium]